MIVIDITLQYVTPILSAVVGGLFGVWLQAKKNIGEDQKARVSNEGIYAEHTSELLDRLDKVYGERNKLQQQVTELQLKVDEQSRTIDELNHQIGGLSDKIGELLKGQK